MDTMDTKVTPVLGVPEAPAGFQVKITYPRPQPGQLVLDIDGKWHKCTSMDIFCSSVYVVAIHDLKQFEFVKLADGRKAMFLHIREDEHPKHPGKTHVLALPGGALHFVCAEDILGPWEPEKVCPSCNGTGRDNVPYGEPCDTCKKTS